MTGVSKLDFDSQRRALALLYHHETGRGGRKNGALQANEPSQISQLKKQSEQSAKPKDMDIC
jgi:hypothetical protein